MSRNIFWFFALLFAIAAGFMINGCGQSPSSSNPHGVITYVGTQSPGDVWSWTVGEGTVIATNETRGKYYSGTFTTLPSGFIKGVINATNDTNVPTDGTGIFYMLEYPSTMLLVKPGNSGDKLIVCAARAAVAPSAGQYNWVKIPEVGWNTNSTAYGTVEVTASGGLYDFDVRTYDINGNFKDATLEAGYSFVSGRLSKAGSDLQIFMTPSGAYMGDSGPQTGGFAGVKNETVNLSEVVSQNYRGVLFSYNSGNGQGETKPVGAGPHPTISGALRGWSYTDVDNNVIDSTSYVTLTFEAQDNSGVLSGIMTTTGGSKEFKMVIAKISGKYVVAGIDAAASSNPENFIVVQQ